MLRDLFESGQMPEDGGEILLGEADGVSHAEIAGEIGVSTTTVDNRLSRMRARFRTRLAALGLLVLVVVMWAAMLAPLGEVAGPAPSALQTATPPPARATAPDAGPGDGGEKSSGAVRGNGADRH